MQVERIPIVPEKRCARCGEHKPESEFWRGKPSAKRPDGSQPYCKDCCRQRHVAYREANRERFRQYDRNRRRHYNAIQTAEYHRTYKTRHRDRVRLQKRRWGQKNPAKVRAQARRTRRRLAGKPTYRLRYAIRSNVYRAIRGRVIAARTFNLLGYTLEQLQQHLETMLLPGMTWSNYGKRWHIDHCRPIASFDFSSLDTVRQCWALANLQPMWAADNIRKRNFWDGSWWAHGKRLAAHA